ncbi:MAG: hypothetical protein JW855_02165 [Gammaproteobacteria bacterium]|nr:hypothetical protein [Gammaproteobacteria bacterium]
MILIRLNLSERHPPQRETRSIIKLVKRNGTLLISMNRYAIWLYHRYRHKFTEKGLCLAFLLNHHSKSERGKLESIEKGGVVYYLCDVFPSLQGEQFKKIKTMIKKAAKSYENRCLEEAPQQQKTSHQSRGYATT